MGATIAATLLALAIAEQLPIRPLPSFEIASWRERVARLRDRMTARTPVYVDLSPDRPYWDSQTAAMWAGLEANVPVINGYSGRYPPDYPDWTRSMTDDELTEWMHGAPVARIRD
jgi:hypothetical protein